MKIVALKETAIYEKRVAITPDIVKKYISLGFDVCVESSLGENIDISDQEYIEAGAKISKIPLEIIADADILLKVQPSILEANGEESKEISLMKPGAIIIALMNPFENKKLFIYYAKHKITSFAMELIPRITRAQSMDVLSSQSNLIGYKAVIDATAEFSKVMPMMTTAAGTIHPAKVLVLGAGVAGLQAIATAKRLGAVVSAFDVRVDAKEQVESLGAKFIQVKSDEDGATAGGYAKEMSDEYKKKQSELIHASVKNHDIVITTALIPGRKAPILITKEMVADMKSGSIIVDLAAVNGGNCELTKQNIVENISNVKIIGYTNYASRIANATSKLYATNLFNFISLMIKDKKISLNLDDEIIKSSMVTHEGAVTNPNFK
jgi:H+-translocating NAD(P) transhydrogenase subunit alpha